MHSRTTGSAFTLIELLIVIGIIAILSIVILLVLNPVQLLMQSRDSNRLSDVASLNSALGIYAAQGGVSLGNPNVVYISIPDPSATSTAGDQCQGLGLPTLPASDTYQCVASGTFRSVTGQGWIPINLSLLAGGSPLGSLPIDPLNTTSSGNYYTYATNGSQYIVTAIPESQKYRTQYAASPLLPGYPGVIAHGSNLTVSPLYSQSGLVGYWPMDEGSGNSTLDTTGNGNNGSWSGTAAGSNGTYYTSGQVGYAGNFDGSTNYVIISTSSMSLSTSFSISFWANFPTVPAGAGLLFYGLIQIKSGGGTPLNFLCGYIESSQNVFTCAASQNGSFPQVNFTTPSANTWYHYVFTYDGTNMKSYSNSIFNHTTAATLNASPLSSVKIGTSTAWFSGDTYMNGSVDDIHIYNRALSAAEVQALYNAQK